MQRPGISLYSPLPIVPENGKFRSGSVGVFDGEALIHMTPPAEKYYDALGAADKQADSAEFVELMLEIIRESLKEVTVFGRSTDQDGDQVTDQDKTPVDHLFSVLDDDMLSAAKIMERLGLSHGPTFCKNYLNPALERN